MKRQIKSALLVLFAVSWLAGCANLVSGVTSQLADNLAATIMDSEDVDTVREGVPAYLLLIDSFIKGDPESAELLLAAASLNGAFSNLVEDPDRLRLLANKSFRYTNQAACITGSILCGVQSRSYDQFKLLPAQLNKADIQMTYAFAVAWVGYIQANSDDWNAIGELGKARMLMERVAELDETYDNGGPHLYLGGMETLLPANLGGNPEKGRQHFEKAMAINESYLMTRVFFAERYGRLMFDQVLHDRLLNEVIEADPVVPGITLANKIAQARAHQLLQSSDDYF